MAKSQNSLLDKLEKQTESLIAQLASIRQERIDLTEQIKELETAVEDQTAEITRMKSKIADSSKDLDIRYRRKREEIQSRLNHVLARLESL